MELAITPLIVVLTNFMTPDLDLVKVVHKTAQAAIKIYAILALQL